MALGSRRRTTNRDFSTTPALTPRSTSSPILETPSPYMMSNSTCLKRRRHSLFFHDLDAGPGCPTTSSRSLIAGRCGGLSRRTEGVKLQGIAASGGFRASRTSPRSSCGIWLMKITIVWDLFDRGRWSLAQRWLIKPRLQTGQAHRPFRLRVRRAAPAPRPESITSTSTAPERTRRVSAISSALFAVVGLRDQQFIDI